MKIPPPPSKLKRIPPPPSKLKRIPPPPSRLKKIPPPPSKLKKKKPFSYSEDDLHDYQEAAVSHVLKNHSAMYWLNMGTGKTLSALTSIVRLHRTKSIKKILVVSTLRICQLVWSQEVAKWQHTRHLKVLPILGSVKKRQNALFNPNADIYTTNFENLGWLSTQLKTFFIDQGKGLPFDMIIFDEISKMKNIESKRFEEFCEILPHFKRFLGMTGSPSTNGYHTLYGQYYCIDQGKRLGNIDGDYTHDAVKLGNTQFLERFFHAGDGQHGKPTPYKNTLDMIIEKVGDITFILDKSDELELPDVVYNDIKVTLPPRKRQMYDEVENEFVAILESGEVIGIESGAAINMKLMQIANYSMYYFPDPENKDYREVEFVHKNKMDALDETLSLLGDESVVISYQFSVERDEILRRHPKMKCLTGSEEEDAVDMIESFNRGDLQHLLLHPRCLSADVEVLTFEDGWIPVVEVTNLHHVFDGDNWVSTDGCEYVDKKRVISVFGMDMTEDHKLLINGEWVEASYVEKNKITIEEACYTKGSSDGSCISGMPIVQTSICNFGSKFKSAYKYGQVGVQGLPNKSRSLFIKNILNLEGYVRSDISKKFRLLQTLWGTGYKNSRELGGFSRICRRYAGKLLGRSKYRKDGRARGLLQNKLHMGKSRQTEPEQTEHKMGGTGRGKDVFSGILQKVQHNKNNGIDSIECWNDGGRGCVGYEVSQIFKKRSKLSNVNWKPDIRTTCRTLTSIKRDSKSMGEERRHRRVDKKVSVYTLLNCGERSRYLIRNKDGDTFISKNSAAHGLNLQQHCSNMIMFGIGNDLEDYEQFIARLVRQSSYGDTVYVHRLLTENTINEVMVQLMIDKDISQKNLKKRMEEYRTKKYGKLL